MPNDDAPEADPVLSSELPFLVDTGSHRYFRVNGITLQLTDRKTGSVAKTIKLVHTLDPTSLANVDGEAVAPETDGDGTVAGEPLTLDENHALRMSLHITQGPCTPQNPNCPPMDPTVDSISMPFDIDFVVENPR